MITRLVLVGLVAALGVTLPSRPDCERFLGSAQMWASGLLADWDTYQPSQSEARLVRDDSDARRLNLAASSRIPDVVDRTSLAPAITPAFSNASRTLATATPADASPKDENTWPDGSIVDWAAILVEDLQPTMALDRLEIEQTISASTLTATANGARPSDDLAAARPETESRAQTLAILPTAVFAAAEERIEEVASLRPLPADVFAGTESMSVVVTVVSPALPADVFAAAEPRLAIVKVIPTPLPADVFAPESSASEVYIVNLPNLPTDPFAPVERDLVLAQESPELPTLCGDEVARVDAQPEPDTSARETLMASATNLEVCGMAPPWWDGDFDEPAMEAIKVDTNSVAVSDRLTTEYADDFDEIFWSELESDIRSTLLTSPGDRSAALKPVAEPEKPVASQSDASHPKVVELGQAFLLTRQALSAWAEVLASSVPVKVTTR